MKVIMVDSLVGNDYTFWLCRGLHQADIEVELVTTRNHIGEIDEPFPILPVSPAKGDNKNKVLKLLEYIYYLIWLLSYVIRSRADIIHFQFFRRVRVECLYFPILSLFSRNLIFTAHNILPHEYSKLDYYLRYLVYSSADEIVVHTDSIKERMLALYKNIPPEKVSVIPAVITVPDNHEVTIDRATARERLNLPQDAYVLLFFGYIREYKGVDWLLDAFEQAKPQHSQLKLVIAGKPHIDELHKSYIRHIQSLQYKDDVIFVPEFIPDEEVDDYFVAADAVAVPYKEIYLSAVLQVAFSYAKPVVVTNVGNFSSLVENGKNGFITEKNTIDELAGIINKAFQDIDALHKMGDGAYEIHKNYPDWRAIGKMTVDLYQEI